MKRLTTKGLLAGTLLTTALLGAACVPATPSGKDWTFRATQVTVNNSQDETCVLICVNKEDEPYILNVNFRVKVASAGSASSFVTGARSNSLSNMAAGDTSALTGAQQSTATFTGVKALDVADLLNSANKLEVFGSYTWAMEEDTIGVATAAGDVAAVLKDALNSTIAASSSLPGTADLILDLIFDNLGSAFTLLLSNIPTLGLGDDALGGGFYIGLGVKGTLGGLIDTAVGTATPPVFDVPVLSLPPDIEHLGVYTMAGTKTFTGQSFSGAGGQHTYTFQSGPA